MFMPTEECKIRIIPFTANPGSDMCMTSLISKSDYMGIKAIVIYSPSS
jgi:hypothetical protein